MPSIFSYTAKNKQGHQITGALEAESSSEIIKQMGSRGYYVVSIKEKKESGVDFKELFKFATRVKTHDLAIFSQQFATMIDAGIDLIESLEILQDQVSNRKLAEVLQEVRKDVATGSNLSGALAQHPRVFPELFCEMVLTGETGGILDKVLLQLADYYERQDEINGKIKKGMYYPSIIVTVAVSVVFFLMVGVVPQFIGIFDSLGGTLPLPTRILLQISTFIQNYWWALILGAVAVFYGLLRYKRTPGGKNKFDHLILKVPIVKTVMRKVYLARVGSTLAILLDSGIDLLSALEIIEKVVGNNIYTEILRNSRHQVREGVPFSQTVEHLDQFPKMMVHMIRIGEESGNLEKMLNKISSFYNREVGLTIDGAITLIEPVLIIFLGLVVGFIVVSIVLPMFEIYQYI